MACFRQRVGAFHSDGEHSRERRAETEPVTIEGRRLLNG
jgi:hypothetical protein